MSSSQRNFRTQIRAARKNLADIPSMTPRKHESQEEYDEYPQQPTNIVADDSFQECKGCNGRDISIQDLKTQIVLLTEQNSNFHTKLDEMRQEMITFVHNWNVLLEQFRRTYDIDIENLRRDNKSLYFSSNVFMITSIVLVLLVVLLVIISHYGKHFNDI